MQLELLNLKTSELWNVVMLHGSHWVSVNITVSVSLLIIESPEQKPPKQINRISMACKEEEGGGLSALQPVFFRNQSVLLVPWLSTCWFNSLEDLTL